MMNTNKFLLGGLVATIAIVSVQITNQLQIQELIEKVETIPQQAAVVTAVETKTFTASPAPTPIENTCLKTSTTTTFGTNTAQTPVEKFSLTTTCDNTKINTLIVGLSTKTTEVLKTTTLKDETTGKTYPIEILKTEQQNLNGMTFFASIGKISIESTINKNTPRTYALKSATDTTFYLWATDVTIGTNKISIPYNMYGWVNGDLSAGHSPFWHNLRCALGIDSTYTYTLSNGTYFTDTCTHSRF